MKSVQEKHNPGHKQSSGNEERKEKDFRLATIGSMADIMIGEKRILRFLGYRT